MRPARPRIAEMMGDDHRDLDAQWERVGAVSATDPAARQKRFAAFEAGLLHHIAVEEEWLFPALETADPVRQTLAARLREEHREIRETLTRIRSEISSGLTSWEELETELVTVLWEHNAREEGAAYPWLDEHLSVERILRVQQAMARRA